MTDNPRPGTYFQEAWTIHRGSFIVIDDRPCKVVKIECKANTSKSLTKGTFKFVAQDIFNGKVHELDKVDLKQRCEVPDVYDIVYRIMDIESDGRLTLRTLNDGKRLRPDLKLPYDDESLAKIRVGFYKDNKSLLVDVRSAMGEQHIITLKEVTKKIPSKRYFERDPNSYGQGHFVDLSGLARNHQ